jgi:hypothetical protein
LHREHIESRFIDLALGAIDKAFTLQNHLAACQVTLNVSLASAVHRLLGESSHTEQPLSEIIQPLLKARTHDANLPPEVLNATNLADDGSNQIYR